ncbi:MAG: hypothetical protein GY777_06200 [Candidatus Brocadiaceae bacterium]|nr:hypothetical protein [Candidatus Brocadiaceae bacterium]
MFELKIKPLSQNDAYDPVVVKRRANGKIRHIAQIVKSKEYKRYTEDLPKLLPTELQLPPGKLVFLVRFHFATASSDYDNPIKSMQDLICNYYAVNDNKIYLGIQEKVVAGKGNERIEFEFLEYHEGMFEKCREMIIKTDGNEDEAQ